MLGKIKLTKRYLLNLLYFSPACYTQLIDVLVNVQFTIFNFLRWNNLSEDYQINFEEIRKKHENWEDSAAFTLNEKNIFEDVLEEQDN